MENNDLFKFHKVEEGPGQIPDLDGDKFLGMKYTHDYLIDFENEYYHVTFWLATNEKGDKLADQINPYDDNQFHAVVTKKPGYEHLQDICASYCHYSINKEAPYDFLIGELFQRNVHFERMHGETGDWEIAARTCIAINDLFEEMFPGYFMTKKKTW